MKITLKDGSVKEYQEAKTVYEIASDISEGLARVACAGEVNGEIVDPFGQLGRGFMSFDLELVGLAFLPWLLFIADFDKDEFAELAKSGRWRQPAAAPKRIVAFLDSSNQSCFSDNSSKIYTPSASVYSPPL